MHAEAESITGHLESEVARLKQAVADRDELLHQLGHELRNRLGALGAALDVLEVSPPDSPVAREARDIVGRQARQLTQSLREILPRIERELKS